MAYFVLFVALGLVLSAIGTLLLAAVPSTVQASNADLIKLWLICFGTSGVVTLLISGAVSLLSGLANILS